MVMIQARNILSRGLTGEKYKKDIRKYRDRNNNNRIHIKYLVTPITLLDSKQFIWDAFSFQTPDEDSIWRLERNIVNWGGYVILCKTNYFTSKEIFNEVKK